MNQSHITSSRNLSWLIQQKIADKEVISLQLWRLFFRLVRQIPGSNYSVCNLAYEELNLTTSNLPLECMQKYYHPVLYVVMCVMLSILSVGTCVGNGMLIFAFILVRRLRTQCNMLIINLALTDLLVGSVVIPIASIYQIYGYWIFDDLVCDGFILIDVLLCTSSILNLFAISIDRYFVITRPFQYAVKRTKRRMLGMICAVWLASALISIPPLFGWRQVKQRYFCNYSDDLGYQIYATFIAFYLPLVVMLVLYGRIFMVAKTLVNQDKRPGVTNNNNNSSNSNNNNTNSSFCDTQPVQRSSGESNYVLKQNQLTVPSSGPFEQNRSPDNESLDSFMSRSVVGSSKKMRAPSSKHGDVKAVKTLGVIMGCFTICWLPFFIFQVCV